MNEQFKTEQERFWAGEFGNEYVSRNQCAGVVAGNLTLFSQILSHAAPISSIIEFGANVGLNLQALKQLLPNAELSAIEINSKAVEFLQKLHGVTVYPQSILDFAPDRERDLVLIKGVLIHTNPDVLPDVYDLLHRTSSRYICLVEYYNPTPVSIPYRGEADKLFKRDFAGEMLDRFPDLRLVGYGFRYHRDANFPQDDATWFLLEKRPR
ncbi:MAG: pseudaminic acid biosynthesis-associated methylase [Sulfuricella sp.]|nr:pseudaminic acid biosynthesis-associated methylase [Sulfuricella sp.]